MNYSKWLKRTFPELESESSVKIFNYVSKAKNETKKLRLGIFLINIVAVALLGFISGYVFSKYTEVEHYVTLIVIGFIIVISRFIFNRIERSLVQKKLIELVGSNT